VSELVSQSVSQMAARCYMRQVTSDSDATSSKFDVQTVIPCMNRNSLFTIFRLAVGPTYPLNHWVISLD